MRKVVRERILRKCKNKCVKCGSTEKLEVDHIIPLCCGGRHDEDNFQILCKRCNLTKKRTPNLEYFDKFFKRGDGKNYIWVSKKLPLKQILKHLTTVLDRQFELLCEDEVNL